MFLINWTDGASGKTFASNAGSTGFKFQNDEISHTLPMNRYRCNLKVWALAQSLEDGHRTLVTLERILSECNEDLFFLFPHQLQLFSLKFLVNYSHKRVIGLAITSAYCSQ